LKNIKKKKELSLYGRMALKSLKEIGLLWPIFINKVPNNQVPYNMGELLMLCKTLRFSTKTPIHEVSYFVI
jgi:hypothetical protein